MSEASGDDLESSAKSLAGVMNQFGLGASEAERTMNALAAGSVAGSANITNVAESMKNFGSVAAGANITMEQSVALVEVLGAKSVFGAEAGTKLRGSILKLQQAGVGYASGQFKINDALTEAKTKIDKLSTAKEKDALILKMFGAENIATGKILLENIGQFEKLTTAVTGTTTAVTQAETNTNTFSVAWEQLKNKWVNIVTGSGEVGGALDSVKRGVQFVTDNLETIVKWGGRVLMFFALWKATTIAAKVVLGAYNLVLGINTALHGKSMLALRSSSAAMKAYIVTTKALTVASKILKITMLGIPIFAIIAGLTALVGVGYAVAKAFDTSTAAERMNEAVKERALENSIDQRVEAMLLFKSLL